MAKAKKKAAARAPKRTKRATKPKARSASAARRAPKTAVKKPAKKAAAKAATVRSQKASRKLAKKAAPKAAKRTLAASTPRGPVAPVKSALVSRRAARDAHAGVKIAADAPERIAPTPRPDATPLKMLFEMPLERPIAPMDVRPAPLFERGAIPFDTEE